MKLSSSFSSSSLTGRGVGLVAVHWGEESGCVGVGRRSWGRLIGSWCVEWTEGELRKSGRAGFGILKFIWGVNLRIIKL